MGERQPLTLTAGKRRVVTIVGLAVVVTIVGWFVPFGAFPSPVRWVARVGWLLANAAVAASYVSAYRHRRGIFSTTAR